MKCCSASKTQAGSPISVKVPPALAVPPDPPQSTCWEKPRLQHQQVGLQHRPNSTVAKDRRGQCWGPSLTLTTISDTAKPQGGQGVLRLRCWTLLVPLGAGASPTQVLAGLVVRCFTHPGAAAPAVCSTLAVSERLTSMSDTTSLSEPDQVPPVCTYDVPGQPSNLCTTSWRTRPGHAESGSHRWRERGAQAQRLN